MATCSGICNITIECPDGCGIVCDIECTECTQWCEPTTVENSEGTLEQGVLIRLSRDTDHLRIGVGGESDPVGSEVQRYGDQSELKVCFHDLPRASVGRLIGGHLNRGVRVDTEHGDEIVSDSASGTVADLASRYSLVLE